MKTHIFKLFAAVIKLCLIFSFALAQETEKPSITELTLSETAVTLDKGSQDGIGHNRAQKADCFPLSYLYFGG